MLKKACSGLPTGWGRLVQITSKLLFLNVNLDVERVPVPSTELVKVLLSDPRARFEVALCTMEPGVEGVAL